MARQQEPKFEDVSLGELIRRCREESKHYLAGRPHDETYCLDLFHRALFEQDQGAWQAIYTQYQTLITDWVWHHSKFPHTGEEAGFFVNAAFAGFWRTVSKPEMAAKFNHLGQLLGYLKRCTHSAIEDEYRRQQRQAQDMLAWEDLSEAVVDHTLSLEAWVTSQTEADSLWRVILSRLRGEAEEVVAILSWLHGLPPQEIQAHRPDLFADVGRVYRIKHKILNRLRHDAEIQQFWKKMR
jgi:DNA-directed RNA polymerase specialized sigma24 family protein